MTTVRMRDDIVVCTPAVDHKQRPSPCAASGAAHYAPVRWPVSNGGVNSHVAE